MKSRFRMLTVTNFVSLFFGLLALILLNNSECSLALVGSGIFVKLVANNTNFFLLFSMNNSYHF